jgi:hypothetical protein
MSKKSWLVLAFLPLLFNCSKPKEDPVPPIIVQPKPEIKVGWVAGNVRDSTVVNKAYSAIIKVGFTYDLNGAATSYPAGTPISSTTLTGFTAVLQAGTYTQLQGGIDTLVFKVSGTSAIAGSAWFSGTIGGKEFSFGVLVQTQADYDCDKADPVTKIVCKANAFIATLDASQSGKLLQPYNKQNASKWSPEPLPCSNCHIGLPVTGPGMSGLLISGLPYTDAQLNSLDVLMRSLKGVAPYEPFATVYKTIMAGDWYLRRFPEVYRGPATNYTFGDFYLAFLGTPAVTGTWQLQLSGHNLAMNITFSNGKVVSYTPNFIASEPVSFSLDPVGPLSNAITPLATRQKALTDLLASFSTAELATAKLNTVFDNLVMGSPANDGQFPAQKQGIPVSSLNSAQKKLVMNVIADYVKDIHPAHIAEIMSQYEAELNGTYIAFSGDPQLKAMGDYVRIDGPGIWMEFILRKGDYFTDKPNYYSVWRDHKKDYNGL